MGITVPSEACHAELAYTGVETTFSPGFKAEAREDVDVVYRNALLVDAPLTLGVHFDCTIAVDGAVTITPIALPGAPGTLIVDRNTPATQVIDFANLGAFGPDVHTKLHSAAAMRDAEARRDIAGKASFAPVLAVVADGNRRVHQVVDWTGGIGPKPDVGVYVGATGYVDNIADAVDIRGPAGAPGSGTGDFIGPASTAADGNVVVFSGTGGKTGKDGGTFASLLAAASLDDETGVAGAHPCDIGAAATTRILITGGAGNVSFAAVAKRMRIVRFPAGKTLKHNATSLVLITGADRVTAAGDQGLYVSDSSGNWREVFFQRADGKATVTSLVDADIPNNFLTPRMLAAAAIAQGAYIINGAFTVTPNSPGANQMTIALKTLNGTDPTTADPVLIAFRNPTAGTGNFVFKQVVAPLSLVVTQGSIFNTSSGVAFRLWFALFNDGGTVRLGAINCLTFVSATKFKTYPLGQSPLALTTAEGGLGGADNAGTFYTDVAITPTPMPYVVLGYATWESGLVTAGNWAAAPTVTQLYGPQVPLPGQRVQIGFGSSGAMGAELGATSGAGFPYDDTPPEITEAAQYLSLDIAPTSKANLLCFDWGLEASASAGTFLTSGLFQAGVTNSLATRSVTTSTAGREIDHSGKHMMLSPVNVLTTFSIRAGMDSGTTTVNGAAGARKFGGTYNSFFAAEEIMR